MKTTLVISDRGTVTLPAALRRELGLEANDLLIAETVDGGLMLRTAVALPIEIYDDARLAGFAAEEADLNDWYSARDAGSVKPTSR